VSKIDCVPCRGSGKIQGQTCGSCGGIGVQAPREVQHRPVYALERAAMVMFDTSRLEGLQEKLDEFAALIVNSQEVGGTVYVFGNGGSASEADHFAGELIGSGSRPSVRAVNLSGEQAALTAVANDLGYEKWPLHFIAATGPRDVVVLLSTSCSDHTGRGSNVLKVLQYFDACGDAQRRPSVILLTGAKATRTEVATFGWLRTVFVPSVEVGEVQEVTLVLLHEIVRRVEAQQKAGGG
jgi:D-sedoheptulose 7-phosphate isomerase